MSVVAGPLGVIYLLHFERPYQHAQHYVGFCEKLSGVDSRLEYHAKGNGSRLMKAVSEAGIKFEIVRLWQGTRGDERLMHNRQSSCYCPKCSTPPRNPRGFKEIQL